MVMRILANVLATGLHVMRILGVLSTLYLLRMKWDMFSTRLLTITVTL